LLVVYHQPLQLLAPCRSTTLNLPANLNLDPGL
jgi:hypothetical protein